MTGTQYSHEEARKAHPEHLRAAAFSIAGAAVLREKLTGQKPVRMTVIPRCDALGYVQHTETQPVVLTKADRINHLTAIVAGAIAERKFVESRKNDPVHPAQMQFALEFARRIVAECGGTSGNFDEDVALLIRNARERAESLMDEHQDAIRRVSQALFDQGELDMTQVESLLGN